MCNQAHRIRLLPSLSSSCVFFSATPSGREDSLRGANSLSPPGSPSRDGDVKVYIFDIYKPTELAHSFQFVLVSISVFMDVSTVFHSTNSPENSPPSNSVLPVLLLPNWSFQLHISL